MSETTTPDLIVTGGPIYTAAIGQPWVEAVAVTDGKISAIGSEAEIRALAGPATEIVDAAGRLVMPGLSDGHIHLGLGGGQAAWELPLLPSDSKEEIFAKIVDWAADFGPDEWIVGGIVGSTVMDDVMNVDDLAALDAASGGRPVLLRDDSMHNRWVNSRALELMGVGADTPDPEGGSYVRDASGALTGVLQELASGEAETAFVAHTVDPDARNKVSLKKAMEVINSYGITAVQDAATMEYSWKALSALEEDGVISAWIVGSMPTRPFIEAGPVGEELYAIGRAHGSKHVRPDFLKFVLDGVPMTRTTAMLHPYICHEHEDPDFVGESYWTLEELVAGVEYCYDNNLGGKLHATGDASVRLVLDAVEKVRAERGPGPIFQIAHVEFVDPVDVPRFAELGVVPDASPYLWYPGVIQESIAKQIPQATVDRSWVTKDFVDTGALLSAGSDWPCVLPTPDPWLAIETLVTRANIDPSVPGELNPSQKLTVEQAVVAFTRNPAQAMGLSDVTGTIEVGLSADFIVLDRNIFEVAPREIHETKVDLTYFEGKKVHERAAALAS
ncbi:amidohydrolase [Amnibacterium flavum]|uniref:Amidohydrolase n=1 Tax=Amnibacterium flavum TaxID=2173173 RepID=A0A2V1HWK1_9MICO|nr:amidohydrolase [Amnibacterium flavum]PVZ94584.1 amidohydrolase [Amnibacterium flavum]